MEPADFGHGDDCAGLGTLAGPGLGRVFPERKVRARLIVVRRHVAAHGAHEMSLVERGDVIEASPTQRPNEALLEG
jgi:hypothetical protein